MIYVSSDLHGFPKERFLAMLDKTGFSEEDDLYILGDVIDRNGDGGIEMLLWMMKQPNVHLLLGNHEGMLLACSFLFEEVTEESVDQLTQEQLDSLQHWMRNGAGVTLQSLRNLSRRNPCLLIDLLDYIREAELYEILKLNGKIYVLDHAGLGNFSPDKDLPDYDPNDLLWHRPALDEKYYPGVTVVFGHTPTDYLSNGLTERMIRTETWIDIDTDAAGGKSPMILRLDDEKAFYETDDTAESGI